MIQALLLFYLELEIQKKVNIEDKLSFTQFLFQIFINSKSKLICKIDLHVRGEKTSKLENEKDGQSKEDE